MAKLIRLVILVLLVLLVVLVLRMLFLLRRRPPPGAGDRSPHSLRGKDDGA